MFTPGDELVPGLASVDTTLDSGIAWTYPNGGSSLVRCGP